MKYKIYGSLFVILLFFMTLGYSKEGKYRYMGYYNLPKEYLAIKPFRVDGMDNNEFNKLIKIIQQEFVDTRLFKLDRQKDFVELYYEKAKGEACDSTLCLSNIGDEVGVDKVISGHLKKDALSYYISLQLIDVKEAKIEKTKERTCHCAFQEFSEEIINEVVRTICGLKVFGKRSFSRKKPKVKIRKWRRYSNYAFEDEEY